MLYLPMPEEVQDYSWMASNCYSWTPWLDLIVHYLESAASVDYDAQQIAIWNNLSAPKQDKLMALYDGDDVTIDDKVFIQLQDEGFVYSDIYGEEAHITYFASLSDKGNRVVEAKKRQIDASVSQSVD